MEQSLSAGGGVGDFRYLPVAIDKAISVEMQWSGTGRKAQVIIPHDVASDIEQNMVPMPKGVVSMEVALGFAVYVAMSCGLPLYLTGDKTVWNELWGSLLLAI